MSQAAPMIQPMGAPLPRSRPVIAPMHSDPPAVYSPRMRSAESNG